MVDSIRVIFSFRLSTRCKNILVHFDVWPEFGRDDRASRKKIQLYIQYILQ